MATFKGQITHIFSIWEKDNSASIEFRLENTDGKYPESAVFKKFAKDDNKKYVLEFEKYNKIGDVVEVEYSQKAEEWNGKWFNKNNVFKTTTISKAESNNESRPNNNDSESLPF